MFNKILIANRGEIAVRIIRAAHTLGVKTVAVYSTADKEALHVQLADEAVCIGKAKSSESYLNMGNIIEAAVKTGAEAIHPGFGFLSENTIFAKLCEDCGIKFIGPSPEVIDMMGNKAKARTKMIEAGVPVVPGSDGLITDAEHAVVLAKEIGYPVLMKASAGGGGRGMRIAYNDEECRKGFETARSEAKVAFGDDSMYMEKFVENPKHIEFQILADEHGNVVHLGERDCSVQRRNQKMIEEAPSALISEELRKAMGDASVAAAKAVGYANAGTIEYLLDVHGDYYFIEMNTRIQVEHPVTEMITGIDLIKEQIKVADGEKLSFTQEEVTITGHAIECRINAEDPMNKFRPSPGKIEMLHLPGGNGVRLDTAAYQDYKIPPTYDSMIGKLIVHGEDRDAAIMKMKQALNEFICEPIVTNVDFQLEILENEDFVDGTYNTGFIPKHYRELIE
jgi:acetyl-CoA carboxylase biotin carboxylase subunit